VTSRRANKRSRASKSTTARKILWRQEVDRYRAPRSLELLETRAHPGALLSGVLGLGALTALANDNESFVPATITAPADPSQAHFLAQSDVAARHVPAAPFSTDVPPKSESDGHDSRYAAGNFPPPATTLTWRASAVGDELTPELSALDAQPRPRRRDAPLVSGGVEGGGAGPSAGKSQPSQSSGGGGGSSGSSADSIIGGSQPALGSQPMRSAESSAAPADVVKPATSATVSPATGESNANPASAGVGNSSSVQLPAGGGNSGGSPPAASPPVPSAATPAPIVSAIQLRGARTGDLFEVDLPRALGAAESSARILTTAI
jgi:hypothetical protein